MDPLGGETKYPFRKMLGLAIDGIVSFSTLPLRFVTLIGFLSAAIAFFGIVYSLGVRLLTHAWVRGWAMSFIGMLFMAGVQLLSLGILGEYVARIYTESKQRPLFLLHEPPIRHNTARAETFRSVSVRNSQFVSQGETLYARTDAEQHEEETVESAGFVALAWIIMFTHPVPLLFVLGFCLVSLCVRVLRRRMRRQTLSRPLLRRDAAAFLLASTTLLYVKAFTTRQITKQLDPLHATYAEQVKAVIWGIANFGTLDAFSPHTLLAELRRASLYLVFLFAPGIAGLHAWRSCAAAAGSWRIPGSSSRLASGSLSRFFRPTGTTRIFSRRA